MQSLPPNKMMAMSRMIIRFSYRSNRSQWTKNCRPRLGKSATFSCSKTTCNSLLAMKKTSGIKLWHLLATSQLSRSMKLIHLLPLKKKTFRRMIAWSMKTISLPFSCPKSWRSHNITNRTLNWWNSRTHRQFSKMQKYKSEQTMTKFHNHLHRATHARTLHETRPSARQAKQRQGNLSSRTDIGLCTDLCNSGARRHANCKIIKPQTTQTQNTVTRVTMRRVRQTLLTALRWSPPWTCWRGTSRTLK